MCIRDRYDEKIVYWPSLYGDLVPKQPRKPDPYPFSFFLLPGNTNSPVILLGPVIGDTVDHTMCGALSFDATPDLPNAVACSRSRSRSRFLSLPHSRRDALPLQVLASP